jgi:hypothetical protein
LPNLTVLKLHRPAAPISRPPDTLDRRGHLLRPHEVACLVKELDELGGTPEAVHRCIASREARGRPLCPHFCPLSQYLRSRCPQWLYEVHPTRVIVFDGRGRRVESLRLPEPVELFVRLFDAGMFRSVCNNHQGDMLACQRLTHPPRPGCT